MLLLPRFDYLQPSSVDEVIRILLQRKGATVLAGGTDLFVQMKKGTLRPAVLVDIKHVSSLCQMGWSGGELAVGAGITLSRLEKWVKGEKDWDFLLKAIEGIGSGQVRNRATVVGNICRASPAGDMAPVLIGLDAKVEVEGLGQKRGMALEDFITGPAQTALGEGEIVTFLRIPIPRPNTRGVYLKQGTRKAMETSIVAVAARMTLNGSMKRVDEARVVLSAVAPRPTRVLEAERLMMREGMNPQTLDQVSELAADERQLEFPPDDN
jgi:carbon-monoxide dehydrogenase medium subunit